MPRINTFSFARSLLLKLYFLSQSTQLFFLKAPLQSQLQPKGEASWSDRGVMLALVPLSHLQVLTLS